METQINILFALCAINGLANIVLAYLCIHLDKKKMDWEE